MGTQNNASLSRKYRVTAVALASGLAALLAGCGKEAYRVVPTEEPLQAPGVFTVPPKVDILLVQDDTGSMQEAYSQMAYEMPEFLDQLGQMGWDYHLATAPLTNFRAIDQVQASRYDANWGSLWLQPYPGSHPWELQNVATSAFRYPDRYSAFLYGNEYSSGGLEEGLKNIYAQMTHSSMTSTGFVRSDSLLAVVVVGNGNDVSGVNFCTRSDGLTVRCEEGNSAQRVPCTSLGQTGCASSALSLEDYKNKFRALRSPALLKMYAAVAGSEGYGCPSPDAYSRVGTRYQQLAYALGGEAYDLCTQRVSGVLSNIGKSLQAVKLGLRTQFLFIAQRPTEETIEVYRAPGGDMAQKALIPRDPSHQNGWDYVGKVTNVYTIDSPVNMNLASGDYAIQLFGSAKLVGEDKPFIRYIPYGAKDAVSQ